MSTELVVKDLENDQVESSRVDTQKSVTVSVAGWTESGRMSRCGPPTTEVKSVEKPVKKKRKKEEE